MRQLLSHRHPTRSFTSKATAISESYLAGTVPTHQCYILLHSRDPPREFPARKSSSVQKALQLRATRWGGIVNFSWSADQPVYKPCGNHDPEVFSATAFSISGGRLEIPELSLANLDEVEARIRGHVTGNEATPLCLKDVDLYVCTHGARDCRCGDMGSQVVKALRQEVEKLDADPRRRVRVGEVGHVGGHKYAANLLVFPHGDWLGNLRPERASGVLKAILDTTAIPSLGTVPLCPPYWRGRMGLSKSEQIQLFASWHKTE